MIETETDTFERYKRRYRSQERFFVAMDKSIAVFLGKPEQAETLPRPRRLLISNLGHLGDLIITCSLLPYLRQALPGVEIGMLCGSWNKLVVENDGLFDRVHYLDHWYSDRRPAPVWRKFAGYLRRSVKLVRELDDSGYDMAIDIRPWLPNSLPVIWRARIPIRLGYSRIGFSPLLTHHRNFIYDRRHERDYQLELLACLPIDRALLARVPAKWMSASAQGHAEILSFMSGIKPERYVVLHPSASTAVRNWTEDGWRELARRLVEKGSVPVFTGLGAEQRLLIDRITAGLDGFLNACDRLSWSGLVALIADAEVVYSVETSIGHLAASLGTPCVAIYGGMQDPLQWKPAGSKVALVTHPVACSPCFQLAGCSHMSCLQKITVDEVWLAGEELLSRASS